MRDYTINRTAIRTAWISEPIDGMPTFILPDDMEVSSQNYHEIFGGLFGRVPIFCVDTMYRNGELLKFGEAPSIQQQVDETCEILEREGITQPIWHGDCGRAAYACIGAKQYPNSHVVLSSPLLTAHGMDHRLKLLRRLLHSTLDNEDLMSYTGIHYFLTVGCRYLQDNPFAFMAAHHRHRKLTLEQRKLMMEHCFPEEMDPPNMLQDVPGKILVITGTDDPLLHPRLLKKELEGLPNVKHAIFEGGHTVSLEHPQDYLDEIYEFCKTIND